MQTHKSRLLWYGMLGTADLDTNCIAELHDFAAGGQTQASCPQLAVEDSEAAGHLQQQGAQIGQARQAQRRRCEQQNSIDSSGTGARCQASKC